MVGEQIKILKKLAIVTTHPIQYNAPWFKILTERNKIEVKVFYTWGQLEKLNKFDPGFGTTIQWDLPLLEGYNYRFIPNISRDPGSHHFKGIDNPGLIKEIDEWCADSILVFGWSFKSHLQVLRHFKGKKKIFFRGDSTLIDERPGFSLQKFARRIFLKWIYSHIDKALYVGTANKNYYVVHGLKEEQLSFAPHAIDNERFKKDSFYDLRSELQIGKNDFVFVFAGKFESKKDPFLLLTAFIELNSPSAHLIFVGNGEIETELKAFVENQALVFKQRVHFLPFQNQSRMPMIYRTGDVFVLPSKGPGETWGLAINEAMACGRAVIVSDACGSAEDLVINGFNGFIFFRGNKSDLLTKMHLTLTEADANLMGQNSYQIIESWNFSNICKAVENITLADQIK